MMGRPSMEPGRCDVDRRAMMLGMTAMAMSAGASGESSGQADGAAEETVYELRIYHLHEGKQALILERFRTKERAIFKRIGMQEVGYWAPTDEPMAGRTLVYMLRHASRQTADANWARFKADPEWVALKAETEKDGPFVKQYDITFLKRTEFSPRV